MGHTVTCRACKEKFDRDKLSPEFWIMPSKNYYYHKKCYDDWAKKKGDGNIHLVESEEYWKQLMWDYLRKDVKMVPDEDKLFTHWTRLRKKGFTAKGIFYTVYYIYDIKHCDVNKANGSIGLVEHLYKEAVNYWASMENQKVGLLKSIEEQINQRLERQVLKYKKEKTTIVKNKFSLEDIE